MRDTTAPEVEKSTIDLPYGFDGEIDWETLLNITDLSDIDKKVVAAVIESYQDAPARPLFSEWGQVWGTWETALLSWSSVKPATVEDAYAEVKAAFEAMMSNF